MPQVEGQEGSWPELLELAGGVCPLGWALLSGRMCRASGGLALGDGSPRCAELPSTHPKAGGLSCPWSRALGV